MRKVSFIMGTLNSEKRIRKTLDSLICQTFKNWELIVIDDGSTDGTFDILHEYEEKDSRIKAYQNKENSGLAVTLNKCIALSSGEYLARIDDDDICFSDRLDKQLHLAKTEPNYTIYGGSAMLISQKEVWGRRDMLETPEVFDVFKGDNFIHPTVLLRKKDIIEAGMYSEDKAYNRCEDYELWCRLYKHGYKGLNLTEPLIYYSEDRQDYKKRRRKYRILFIKAMVKQKKELGIGLVGIPIIGVNIIKLILPNYVFYIWKKVRNGGN